MLKVLGFLTRREGLERRAFIDHFENHHVPLIGSLVSPPLSYKRNYLVRGDELNREHASIDFDVVTELVFADRAAFLAWSATLFGSASIAADAATFLDRSRTKIYVTEEHVTSG